jgi:indole-3-glycerol phosphate synthase
MLTNVDYRLPKELEGTVLEKIMQARLPEIAGARAKWPAEAIRNALEPVPRIRSLKRALSRGTPSVIAELKKASPSAGVLRQDFDPVAIALEFAETGAAALSILTEPRFFQGTLENIARVRWKTGMPLLCKDFIVDPFQILEARHAGADAVLLIAALLDLPGLNRLRAEAEALGMEALVEVHNEGELGKALQSGAALIGVNSRDLRTFAVSLDTALDLARHIPAAVVKVAESGIRTGEDIKRLWDAGYHGFLIGETLMRAQSPGAALKRLIADTAPASRRKP